MIVFIIAQILTAIGYMIFYIKPFLKNKTTMQLFQTVSSVFKIVSLLLLKAYTGMISCCISIPTSISIYLNEKNKDKGNYRRRQIIIALFFTFINIISGIYLLQFNTKSNSIISLLPMITSSIVLLSNVFLREQAIRIWGLVASIGYAIYQYSISNYTGLILEAFLFLSFLLAYIKNDKKDENKKKDFVQNSNKAFIEFKNRTLK